MTQITWKERPARNYNGIELIALIEDVGLNRSSASAGW